jgi:hypothetical protein
MKTYALAAIALVLLALVAGLHANAGAQKAAAGLAECHGAADI